jgi:hypothetical protein
MSKLDCCLSAFVFLGACGQVVDPSDPDPTNPKLTNPHVNPGSVIVDDRVTVVVTALPGARVTVIAQADDGPWQILTRTTGTFTFEAPGGRYGVATICGSRSTAFFQYGTIEEAPTVSSLSFCDFSPVVQHTISGTATNLGGGDLFFAAGVDASASSTDSYSFSVDEAASTEILFGRSPLGEGLHVDRLVVRRDVPVVHDLIQNVDFSVDGNPTESRPVRIVGVGSGEQSHVDSALITASSFMELTVATDAVTVAIPATTEWASSDSIVVDANVSNRAVSRVFASHTDVPTIISMHLPPALEGFTVAATSSGRSSQFESGWLAFPEATVYQLKISSFGIPNPDCGSANDGGNPRCFPTWRFTMTPGFVGAGPDLAMTTPVLDELDALGVWDHRLDFPSGAEAVIMMSAGATHDDEQTSSSANVILTL